MQEAAGATDALLGHVLAQSASPRLAAAMRYATLGAGKRLRPFLVIESARLFNVPPARALRVGAALECVHCYSLIHDDLPAMDNDDMRRGKPTTHKQFDEATAILAGDALLTLAFEILADGQTHPDAKVRSALVLELAKASGKDGMAGGQMLDIEAESEAAAALAAILRIQSHKTGALFRFACEAGAILAGADAAPLRRYADGIGLAFQIADDLLDLQATPEQVGKATQKDRRKGKATFVSLMGAAAAKAKAAELVRGAIAALEGYGAKADALRSAAQFIVTRKS
ncbi:MAG: polyprenyl synthetase family protein [Aestuariivirga sp.]